MPTRQPRKSSFSRPALRHRASNLPAVIVFMVTFNPTPIIYYSSSLRAGDFDGEFCDGGFHATQNFAGPQFFGEQSQKSVLEIAHSAEQIISKRRVICVHTTAGQLALHQGVTGTD